MKDAAGNGYEYLGSLIYRRSPSGLELESTDFAGGRILKTSAKYDLRYFVRDYLGSVRAIVNAQGQRLEAIDYMPYGSRWRDPMRLVTDNRFLFNGKEWQPTGDLDVLDYGARHYDPLLGRWFNPDPAMQFLNPYTFCGNDPINGIDYDGCMTIESSNDWYDDIIGRIDKIKGDTESNDKGPESATTKMDNGTGGSYHYFQTTNDFGVVAIYRFSEIEWLVLNSLHSEEAMLAAMQYLVEPSHKNFLRMVRKELVAQWTDPELLVAGATIAVTALSPKSIKFKYNPKVFEKGFRERVSHNFPYCFDKVVFTAKPIIKPDGYQIYRVYGKMNGKFGVFEIGVDNGIIDHRFFRPLKNRMMKYLAVDGYLNGTGINDRADGGYIEHDELGLSPQLSQKINDWLERYWNEFYGRYKNPEIVKKLDEEGQLIARLLMQEFESREESVKIEYYSDAHMKIIPFDEGIFLYYKQPYHYE